MSQTDSQDTSQCATEKPSNYNTNPFTKAQVYEIKNKFELFILANVGNTVGSTD